MNITRSLSADTSMATTVRRLAPSLGAELDSIDARDQSPEIAAFINDQISEHKLVVLRDQNLDVDALYSLSERLGKTTKYPFVAEDNFHSHIVRIVNPATAEEKFSTLWHCDSSYLEAPPTRTALYGVTVPPLGGDTVFSNSVAAFDALSDCVKELLCGLSVLNVSNLQRSLARSRFVGDAPEDADTAKISRRQVYQAVHQAVTRHPRTGEQALYVNEEHTYKFNELSGRESTCLRDMCLAQIAKHEFTCRVRWEPGTLVIWDNFLAQHRALNDYSGFERVMLRATYELCDRDV